MKIELTRSEYEDIVTLVRELDDPEVTRLFNACLSKEKHASVCTPAVAKDETGEQIVRVSISTNATRYERWQNKLYCCLQNGLSVLDEDISYKNTYKHKVLNDDYYKILKEDIDNVISYSVTFKQVVERLKKIRLSSLFS